MLEVLRMNNYFSFDDVKVPNICLNLFRMGVKFGISNEGKKRDC